MRKLHIALLCVFSAGVLLGGIGTGIALGEFSDLTYQGEVLLGEENVVTKEFYYDFSSEDGEQVFLSYCHWGDQSRDSLLVEDQSVPVGTVCYSVTYNEEMVRPKLIYWEQEQEDDGWTIVQDADDEDQTEAEGKVKKRRVMLELRNIWIGNEFDVMMQNKDHILEDLKQNKIGSYEIAGITDVEIRVNPDSLPYIEDQTR